MMPGYMLVKVSEYARGIARRALPPGMQRALKFSRDAFAVIRREGFGCYAELRRNAKPAKSNSEYTLRLRTLKFPFILRGGPTDYGEFVPVVMTELLSPFLPEKAQVILDAGAYIGDSTCWYLTRFPAALVVAIEPDTSNFNILARNVRPYGSRCVLLKGAVWPRRTRLRVSGSDAHVLSASEARDGEPFDCEAFTIPDILRRIGSNTIDIMKCNIEGAEEQLFSQDADEWLRRTSLVYVQAHNDRAREAVLSAAGRNRFCCHVYRGFHILRRN